MRWKVRREEVGGNRLRVNYSGGGGGAIDALPINSIACRREGAAVAC